MNKVVICIPTYKRIDSLKTLIKSISNCPIDFRLIRDLSIIVCDNDANESARESVSWLQKHSHGKFDIEYMCQPEKGISNVRNALLKRAVISLPEFIIFVDDDEYVSKEWLNALVETAINNNSDFVRGPVISLFDQRIPNYINYWFKRENFNNNDRVFSLITGNLLVRTSSFIDMNIWFDKRFNIIGSGDTYFGKQVLKKNAIIHWASNAVAYEVVPSERARLGWIIKRVYRCASTYTYTLKIEKQYLKILRKILVSSVNIIIGLACLLLAIIPIRQRYWGVLRVADGLGGIAGLGSILYKEYK